MSQLHHSPAKLFAVIPAAGRSRRMGRPKLLLPLGKQTVIARVLEVLNRPEIAETFVVTRNDDTDLNAEIQQTQATVLSPATAPPEMRDSVEFALQEIEQKHRPAETDGWILIPADHPLLCPDLLEKLFRAWQTFQPEILNPTHAGKRGHPTIFRWSLVSEVFQIPADQGLNRLVRDHSSQVFELEVPGSEILLDLDTPEDSEKLLGRNQ